VLVEREADEALEARQEYPALLEEVLVLQAHLRAGGAVAP
jgi:hypothetical protein